MLKLKVHRAGIKKCQYSRDGSKVVSCSQDCGVKVQDLTIHLLCDLCKQCHYKALFSLLWLLHFIISLCAASMDYCVV